MEAAGRGRFHPDAEEGQVVFSTDLEDGQLDIYIDGFAVGGREPLSRILFVDVFSVTSHLNAPLFSQAGRSGKLDFYLPLEVRFESSNVPLSVPFLAYSNVLNILVGLREDWVSQVSREG
ncbi:hypothetical protein [Pseudomonas sp. B22129]|uniref:hypothetical protein n=1 Tax=Pseudomonas sp. B22129 TaxID=3235111 RepID=UPI0037842CB5